MTDKETQTEIKTSQSSGDQKNNGEGKTKLETPVNVENALDKTEIYSFFNKSMTMNKMPIRCHIISSDYENSMSINTWLIHFEKIC